jgi:hypothetical protein
MNDKYSPADAAAMFEEFARAAGARLVYLRANRNVKSVHFLIRTLWEHFIQIWEGKCRKYINGQFYIIQLIFLIKIEKYSIIECTFKTNWKDIE